MKDAEGGVKVSEAAEHYGVTVATIRRWADKGLIKSYRSPSGQRRVVIKERKSA